MSYYTERHGLRAPVERTETITHELYALIFDCCERYFDNIAWKYPEECPDGNGCCGLDIEKFSLALKFEIPNLFQKYGTIRKPQEELFNRKGDSYDQYGLLDFIEFMFDNMKDIRSRSWHDYYHHTDLTFFFFLHASLEFRNEINNIFQKTGLMYILNDLGMVERVDANGVLSKEIEAAVTQVPEKGLKELLQDAILLYKTPGPQARQDSVERIWDALERLKSFYATSQKDKLESIKKITNDIAGGQTDLVALFDDEIKALTIMGNKYKIRHHETYQVDITDSRHYDYFFNRCLSLIALAIQYLK